MQFNQFCVYEGIKQTSECLHVKFVKMMDSQFKLFLGALNQDSAFFKIAFLGTGRIMQLMVFVQLVQRA